MRFERFALALFSLLPVSLASSASAAEALKVVASDFPPYVMEKGFEVKQAKTVGSCKVDKGTYRGIDVDFFEAVLKRAGIPYKVSYLPFARLKDKLQSGEAEAVPGFFYAEDNGKPRYKYVQYDGGGATVFYKKKGSPLKVEKPEDLKGKNIAVVRDDSYGTAYDLAKKNGFINIKPANEGTSDQMNLDKLVEGRVELVALNSVAGSYIVANQGYFDKVETVKLTLPYGKDPKETGIYLAFSQKVSNEIVTKVQKAVDDLKKEQALACIRARYGLVCDQDGTCSIAK